MTTRKLLVAGIALAAITGCGEPNLEWNCTMNGYGSGSCSFTNTGDAEGAVCGTVRIFRGGSEIPATKSAKFCSGTVEPKATTNVEFSAPAVNDICSGSLGDSWTDRCGFSFVPDGSDRAKAIEEAKAKATAELEASMAKIEKERQAKIAKEKAAAAAITIPETPFPTGQVMWQRRRDVVALLGEPAMGESTWEFGDLDVELSFLRKRVYKLTVHGSHIRRADDVARWLALPGWAEIGEPDYLPPGYTQGPFAVGKRAYVAVIGPAFSLVDQDTWLRSKRSAYADTLESALVGAWVEGDVRARKSRLTLKYAGCGNVLIRMLQDRGVIDFAEMRRAGFKKFVCSGITQYWTWDL